MEAVARAPDIAARAIDEKITRLSLGRAAGDANGSDMSVPCHGAGTESLAETAAASASGNVRAKTIEQRAAIFGRMRRWCNDVPMGTPIAVWSHAVTSDATKHSGFRRSVNRRGVLRHHAID